MFTILRLAAAAVVSVMMHTYLRRTQHRKPEQEMMRLVILHTDETFSIRLLPNTVCRELVKTVQSNASTNTNASTMAIS